MPAERVGLRRSSPFRLRVRLRHSLALAASVLRVVTGAGSRSSIHGRRKLEPNVEAAEMPSQMESVVLDLAGDLQATDYPHPETGGQHWDCHRKTGPARGRSSRVPQHACDSSADGAARRW